MSHAKQAQSFPFKDVMRDLAVLRVSDIDLSALTSSSTTESSSGQSSSPVEQSLQQSYEFVRQARATIRIKDRGTLDSEVSEPLEGNRAVLDEVLKGLEGQS